MFHRLAGCVSIGCYKTFPELLKLFRNKFLICAKIFSPGNIYFLAEAGFACVCMTSEVPINLADLEAGANTVFTQHKYHYLIIDRLRIHGKTLFENLSFFLSLIITNNINNPQFHRPCIYHLLLQSIYCILYLF